MPYGRLFVPHKRIVLMSIGGNRNALNREIGSDGKRDWSFDLIDTKSPCDLCVYTRVLASSPSFHPSYANHGLFFLAQSSGPSSALASFTERPSSASTIWRIIASLSLGERDKNITTTAAPTTAHGSLATDIVCGSVFVLQLRRLTSRSISP